MLAVAIGWGHCGKAVFGACRAGLYRELALTLKYEKQAPTGQERVHAWLELCRGGGRI